MSSTNSADRSHGLLVTQSHAVWRVVPGASWHSDGDTPPDNWSGYPRTAVDSAAPVEEWHSDEGSAISEAKRIAAVYSHRQPGYQRDDPLKVFVFSCRVARAIDAFKRRCLDYEIVGIYQHGMAPKGVTGNESTPESWASLPLDEQVDRMRWAWNSFIDVMQDELPTRLVKILCGQLMFSWEPKR